MISSRCSVLCHPLSLTLNVGCREISMADFIEPTQAVSNELACSGCGALLTFKPGTLSLTCNYCGATTAIASPDVQGKVEETDLGSFLEENFAREASIEAVSVKCETCGATSTLSNHVTADACPFCGTALVVRGGDNTRMHRPQYVLPFVLDKNAAMSRFASWLKGLWFAPNNLKHYADRADKLVGVYLPFWTFDCKTDSSYTGQRGENYYVTENYTVVENGRNVTRSRQVQKTRWYPASGRVNNAFDDIVIEATTTLERSALRRLEPWDLDKLVPYDDKFLSGFRTLAYDSDLRAGYDEAKQVMQPAIESTVRRDIGGDKQLIHYVNTTYHDATFKHVLLPVWVSAYKYKDKLYQFFVNARTGEVQGKRPYSAAKITLAVLGGILVAVVIWWLAQGK